MRLRATLLDIAAIATTAIASTACGGQESSTAPAADAAADDVIHPADSAAAA